MKHVFVYIYILGGVQKHKPIIVRGLGRHLEMCARAKWQREEQFAREEKVK